MIELAPKTRPVYTDYLTGHLIEKKHYVVGTDLVATPINTYNAFGFNLSMQNMSRYLLIYSPMLFMDMAYQQFVKYLNTHKPKYSEKNELNKIKFQFRKYFGSFLRESSDYEIILSLFDESGDKWSEITANMSYAIFNTVAKYVTDTDRCRKFSELMGSYCWINFSDVIYDDLAKNGQYMERDKYELTTRNVFSEYLTYLIGGSFYRKGDNWCIDNHTREIIAEIGKNTAIYSTMIFKHFISMLDKYKQSNSVAL